ncbi:MAG: hypothetical protein JWM54_924, partial [Acidobacteriaceae bacterium]|nr:hypothetical protein [Acidobacteriaceae bacterium]
MKQRFVPILAVAALFAGCMP